MIAKHEPSVLSFYRNLPFNFSSSPEQDAQDIRDYDPLDAYPPLHRLVRPGKRVLDVGCGTGWLSNGLAFHHDCRITGIDFNPVALERAAAVSSLLGCNTTFACENLFHYTPETKFPLVVSLGVLHHTDDCHRAINAVCTNMLADGGHFLVGLYHLHGRAPFLDHFASLKESGATEADLFKEFLRLQPNEPDETRAYSWFRDQVLHPHETQHTAEEIQALFKGMGLQVVTASLNGFAQPLHGEQIRQADLAFGALARTRLASGQYFPGFFAILARKPSPANP